MPARRLEGAALIGLYRQVLVLWAEQQGALLRAAAPLRCNEPIDWEHVAEEIESSGRSQVTEARNRRLRIVEHLSKLHCSPSSDPRHGRAEAVRQQRAELVSLLEDSPSLAPRLPELLEQICARAARDTAAGPDDWGEAEPAVQKPARAVGDCGSTTAVLRPKVAPGRLSEEKSAQQDRHGSSPADRDRSPLLRSGMTPLVEGPPCSRA